MHILTEELGFGTITVGVVHSEWSICFKIHSLVNISSSKPMDFLKASSSSHNYWFCIFS